MITRYVNEDITQTELKYIAHGVNCQNRMGAGVAGVISKKFPEVKESFHMFAESNLNYLGNTQLVVCNQNTSDEKYIYNCFTQRYYGRAGKRYTNYSAIIKCFDEIKEQIGFNRGFGPLAIPKIGCGLGGGDWNVVEQLINDTLEDDLEVWVYQI